MTLPTVSPTVSDQMLARFDTTIAALDEEEEKAKTQEEADAAATQQKSEDRSTIAKTVIFTYAAIVALGFFYIVFSAPACPDGQTCGNVEAWTAQMDMLRDMIVTVVLPIVTLMLGFYFGTESAKKPAGGEG